MLRYILLFLCGGTYLLLGGCSTTVKRLSAKEYYTKANEAFVEESFSLATEQYRELLDQYPLNPYAEEAQLKIAYSYYLDKQYAEAIAAFNDFERAYPTSPHLSFVEYYRGMCYLEQMRSIDRDQSVTEKAYDHFRAVIDRYPESNFATQAEEKINICRQALAAHELYVADFNQKIYNDLATKARLRVIIERYPETKATTAALVRLERILTEEGQEELAALAAKARALRRSATPSEEQTTVASLAPPNLPAPSVDPLLLLVTELKKQQEQQRQQVTEARKRAAQQAAEGVSEEESEKEVDVEIDEAIYQEE